MKLVPYLSFDGNCHEAFAFYETALGGKILDMTSHGDTPEGQQVGEDWKDKIINAHMVVGDYELMGADTPPEYRESGPNGFSLSLQFTDAGTARKTYDALADGGTPTMPFDSTSWSPGFGMVTDKFGVAWMVNTTPA